MTRLKHPPGDEALTALILEVFRLNGRLLASGDRLVAPLGLTSARWQVLGAVHYSAAPQPVSWLARNMGLNRQGVQRIVKELAAEGVLEFRANPHHRRAQLVTMSEKGAAIYGAAERLQAPWANRIASGLPKRDIETATVLLGLIRERLQAESASLRAENDG